MQYTNGYESPLGGILLASDGKSLTGIWFEGQKYFARTLGPADEERNLPVFDEAKAWLGSYFEGNDPGPLPPLRFAGTDFQNEVWGMLAEIPYGQTCTYGDLAREYARRHGLENMSPQAVGGAVGRNPISIVVPCHRVVGSNGSLTGYAGGISKKIELLKMENALDESFFVPKKTTAP